MGKKKIVAIVSILALMISLFCFTPDVDAGIQKLNLSKQTKEIKVGESFQLSMNGVKVSSIKWKSSKPKIAKVSKKGVVKGLKVGTTTITGKYKSLKFSITVKVVAKQKKQEQTEPTPTPTPTPDPTPTPTPTPTPEPTPGPISSLNGLSLKYKSSGFATIENEEYWALTFTLTNNSKVGVSFWSDLYQEVYINGIEQYYDHSDNLLTKVINGASIDVTLYFKANVGDTVYAIVTAYNDKGDRVVVCEVPEITIK